MVIVAVIFNAGLLYLSLPGPSEKRQNIIVEEGSSTGSIGKMLQDKGILRYPMVFNFFAKCYGVLGRHLKSGEYTITAHVTPFQLFKILASGQSILHKFTIPEGATTHEIITRLKAETILKGDIEDEVTEGILMPQTYFFSYGDTKQKLLSSMKRLMSEALDRLMPELSPNSPLKTRMDVLNLASIVEKEAYLEEEKPRIAAALLNRLRKKMKLQADPTTIYGITLGKHALGRLLTKSDLRSNSLYNTYYISGLPPSPIACPSLSSIEAVIKPHTTKELYFVANGNGGHNFSEDLTTHNKYIREYKQKLAAAMEEKAQSK